MSKQQPSLQGDMVEMMLESSSEEAVQAITKLYDSGTTEARVAILGAFLRRGVSENEQTDEGWKPLLAAAVAAPDPQLRRSAAEVLGRRSPKLAAPLVGPLLADEDRETRLVAANVVLRILNADHGGSASSTVYFSSSTAKTNKPIASATQTAAWHSAMLQRLGPAPDWNLAAAVYATGDAKTDLPLLLTALENTNNLSAAGRLNRQAELMAIELIVSKLPWPEGRPVLEKLSASPLWFAMAASQSGRCQSKVLDYLLDPTRFKAVLESANGSVLSECLEQLAGYDYEYRENHQWSLWTETDRTKAVALTLVESTNAAWRAVAVFSLGLRADATGSQAVFEKAIADPNPWVQAVGIKAMARNTKDRPALEQHLAPLLSETNLVVATPTATALLEPEIRQAAGLMDDLSYFEFENARGGRSRSYSQNEERPLTALDSKPAYLQPARERLAAAPAESSAAFVLLLAQHGEFDGVDRLAAQWLSENSHNDQGDADALLTGIALSRDIKYLPVLKQMVAVQREASELRKCSRLKKETGYVETNDYWIAAGGISVWLHQNQGRTHDQCRRLRSGADRNAKQPSARIVGRPGRPVRRGHHLSTDQPNRGA